MIFAGLIAGASKASRGCKTFVGLIIARLQGFPLKCHSIFVFFLSCLCRCWPRRSIKNGHACLQRVGSVLMRARRVGRKKLAMRRSDYNSFCVAKKSQRVSCRAKRYFVYLNLVFPHFSTLHCQFLFPYPQRSRQATSVFFFFLRQTQRKTKTRRDFAPFSSPPPPSAVYVGAEFLRANLETAS